MADKANVLSMIIDHKRAEIRERKLKLSLSDLKALATPNKKSFLDALRQPGCRYILEYKRASPSNGNIRPNFSVDDCVSAYETCADCYSVLTDRRFFNGSHLLLKAVSEKTQKPVLCKDFIIDSYQVYEARVYGASAILLMLSVLDDETYRLLANIAVQLNMDVLTEVHTKEECIRAKALGANLIGINNRDLRSLNTDLKTTEDLRPLLSKEAVVVSESGIEQRSDIVRLAPLVDGFLVGSSLMSARDVGLAAKSLVFGTIKICGVKTAAVAQSCFNAGASYVGLMCYSKSPRYVDINQACDISRSVPGQYVAVFVNQTIEAVVEFANKCRISVVQLHGDEPITYVKKLKQNIPDLSIWKAIPIDGALPLETIMMWLSIVDKVVLDCHCDQVYGGSGQSFNWQMLDELFNEVDEERIVIAGGVSESNVYQLKQYTRCILDLSSSVETVRGEKSEHKIQQFFESLRHVS
jgi:indole-3-glycerol phosphate synthase/phosphoribosylanthranilate isomerase